MRQLIVFLLLVLPNICIAGQVLVEDALISYDDEYSLKDYTGWNFNDRPEYNFSNKVIYGTRFSQEFPNTSIFPNDMTNVTFVYCHLENVVIPEGVIVINPDCDGTPCWTGNLE